MAIIPRSVVTQGMTYDAYVQLMETLLAEGKTTGANQSESLVNFTRLNLQRMHRIEKQTTLSPALEEAAALAPTQLWLVITEAWCGDAANSIPVMHKLAEKFPNIALKMILRDENPDIMDQFLTDGSRAIPKIIALDPESLEVKGVWGPRPAPAQKLFKDLKAKPVEGVDPYREVQIWYNTDKSETMQTEFADLLRTTTASI